MTAPDMTNILLLAILVALIWIGRTLLAVERGIRRTREYLMTCGLTDAYNKSRLETIVSDLNALNLTAERLSRK